MELYILSKQDLSILSICKLADYQINLDEETNAKSTFTLMKTNGLKKENYMVLNGLYRQFIFVIDDVQTEKESDVVTVTALDISNVFNRKVIEKNIDTMKSKSIEEFLANTISENFVNSDDTALNVNYIEIYWHTNTQGNVATNAENGLYNFHTFLINCRQYKNIYTDFKLENLGNPQTVEGKRISVEARNRKIVDISLHGESTQNGTPTSDKPSPIKNVEGKNKLDLSKCTFNNCTLNADGKSITSNIANQYYCSIITTELNEFLLNRKGKEITFSTGKGISNRFVSIVIKGVRQSGSAYQEMGSVVGGSNVTIKIAEDFTSITALELRFNRSGATFSDTTTTIPFAQLVEGSVATPYAPYNSLVINDVGKNLFDEKTIFTKGLLTLNGDGFYVGTPKDLHLLYGTDTNGIPINFKENTQYSISFIGYKIGEGTSSRSLFFKVRYSDGTSNDINIDKTSPKQYKFVTLANKTVKNILLTYGTNVEFAIKDVQIEEDTEATDYEPYKSQVATFPLTKPLRSLPNGVKDTIEEDGIHRRVGSGVFSTVKQVYDHSGLKYSVNILSVAGTNTNELNINMLCNKANCHFFPHNENDIYIINNKTLVLFGSTDDTVETFNEKFAGAEYQYELAEEVVEPFTEEQQEAYNQLQNLTLFEGVNHISSDANMVLKYYPLEPVGLKFVLRIDIENKQETTELIDTTLPEVADYNKIYEEDVTAKVQVYIREDGSEYNLYLKTDRTTTTDKDDPDRASGKIEVISVETADRAAEEALNVMKGNNYKHLVEFKIAKTSKLMDITELHIGRPIRIKTDDDIYDSYISAITLSDENFVYFKSGSLRITLLDKLKKSNDSAGNKLDVTGGKILGNLNILDNAYFGKKRCIIWSTL